MVAVPPWLNLLCLLFRAPGGASPWPSHPSQGTDVALLVPQVQQTRNASPQGLFLIWTALLGPQRELRMQEEQPAVTHVQLSLIWGAKGVKHLLGQVPKCQWALQVRSWVEQQRSVFARALGSLSASVPGAAQVPCSRNALTNTQIHSFGYIYTYIHTYTQFPVKSNKSISLCV